MTKASDILQAIDPRAPYSMNIEASVREYCVLALEYVKGLPDHNAIDREAQEKKHAAERYAKELYSPSTEELLADAIADHAFAQSERLFPGANFLADHREREMVNIVAVYTLFALVLHQRTDFAVLFLEAWHNFNLFAGARVIRKKLDRSWGSRYSPLFYPLG